MTAQILKIAAASVVALGFGVAPSLSSEHETCGVDIENAIPDGVVSGSMTTIGFIASARWGDGILHLSNGGRRTFHLVGAKVLETGAASDNFVGEVYNLKNVGDFEGTYYGASTGIRAGKLGNSEGVFNNANCVVVKVRMTGAGLKVSGPAPGGIQISFID